MGLTPLEGLVMGTRSGDIDPAVVFHLKRVAGMSTDEIDVLLNKRSGLVGLCGDNDMREIRRRIEEGDEQAALAFDIYIHRLKKYIGAYAAVLGRVDAVAFTAGVGENSAPVREAAIAGLEEFGLAVDADLNAVRSGEPRPISPEYARVAVTVACRPTRSWRSPTRPSRSSRSPLRPDPGPRTGRQLSTPAPLCIFHQTEYSAAKQTDRIRLMRRSKIVCTLGPAVDSHEQLVALIEAGMSVARFNFSHGTHEEHQGRYDRVRKAAAETGRAVGVLADLQGPKIRLAKFAEGPVELVRGDEFTITSEDVPGDKSICGTTYKGLPGDVTKGDPDPTN
ncbi:acetate kinase [Streptomyces microflavus]